MTARPVDDDRAATPLELLFDLTFVIAVEQIADELTQNLQAGHLATAIFPYLAVFFAIWWAWMNFTWFASGYGNDDAVYRVMTMLQMAGVLILAAGVPASINDGDYRTITFGYFTMRVGLVAQWLRVAHDDPGHRHVALRNGLGFSVVQAGWLLRLLLPGGWNVPMVLLLAALDLSVPLWASRAGDPSWNAKHIAERYGLFAIILLGEGMLAAFSGVQSAVSTTGISAALVVLVFSALLIIFSLWWLYYLQPAEEGLRRRREFSYVWGYAHYLIFAALAALGAGLEVAILSTSHPVEVSAFVLVEAVSLPVAVFFAVLWAVNSRLSSDLALRARVLLPGALLIVLAPAGTGTVGVGGSILGVALICCLVVAVAVTDQAASSTRAVRGRP